MKKEEITLRKLTADDGMVIADKETEMIRSEIRYLGKEDSEDNYIEIDENAPMPEPETAESEAT